MHRGSWKSSSSPRNVGVQWSSTVESTLWGMAPGVAVVLGLAEIAPASWRLLRAVWLLLWGVPSSRRGVAAFRGFYRPGSCPVSRPEPLPWVVPMSFEGSAEGKLRRRYGELAI